MDKEFTQKLDAPFKKTDVFEPGEQPAAKLHAGPVHGKSTVKPLVIEICAGTAMLSRCFQEVGFDVVAVDHTHNRFHPLAHICTLDLTLNSSWELIEFLEYIVRNFPCLLCACCTPLWHLQPCKGDTLGRSQSAETFAIFSSSSWPSRAHS